MRPLQKKSKIVRVISSMVIGVMLLTTAGCATVMAAKQPGKKNLRVLDNGTPRTHVIAEFGAPTWTGEREGKKVDVFAFRQGYSKGAKAGRALFHGVADFFTLGVWEVVGTPAEAALSGTDVKVEVIYDENDRVLTKSFINTGKE